MTIVPKVDGIIFNKSFNIIENIQGRKVHPSSRIYMGKKLVYIVPLVLG